MFWRNKYWYIPSSLTLAGFYLGSLVALYLIQDEVFLNGKPEHLRRLVEVYICGLLGACITGSVFFARDAKEKIAPNNAKKEGMPTFLDPFGCALFIIGAGVAEKSK